MALYRIRPTLAAEMQFYARSFAVVGSVLFVAAMVLGWNARASHGLAAAALMLLATVVATGLGILLLLEALSDSAGSGPAGSVVD